MPRLMRELALVEVFDWARMAVNRGANAALLDGAAALGLAPEPVIACLGETTYDVYLNDRAYWRNVLARVWDYTIGGYQVLKKWLSYRERDLLDRSLTPGEVREAMHIARRIAAILLLGPALDANYLAVKAHTYPWPGNAERRLETPG